MKRLRLLRLGSYVGYGVRVTQAQPFVEADEATATKLVADGCFEEVFGPSRPASDATERREPQPTRELTTTEDVEAAAKPQGTRPVPGPITTEDVPVVGASRGGRRK